jgi:hypothetical protein
MGVYKIQLRGHTTVLYCTTLLQRHVATLQQASKQVSSLSISNLKATS